MKKTAHPNLRQSSQRQMAGPQHSDDSKKETNFFENFKSAVKKCVGVFTICHPSGERKTTSNIVASDDRRSKYKISGSSFSTDLSSESNNRNSSAKWKYSSSFASSSTAASGQLGTGNFSFEEIYKATDKFSPQNQIGEGGFGTVYKGRLNDGSLVAIKRAKKNAQEKNLHEFRNEISTLSKIEHLNLVRLYGYLEHADERIIVVEYVGNGTLREHLDGTCGEGLEIGERLDIAIDIAHAITYLHVYADHPVFHRDIKASNILITEKLRAKVADFGFARLAPEDPGATHVSTQIKGTAGYLDPEYLRTYQLTEKSDVYSFGVLLVEMMTGRYPIEPKRSPSERVTIRWAMQMLKQRDAVIAMDPRMRRNPASNKAVEKVLKLAHQCLAPLRQSRPTMKSCAEVLWTIRKDFRDDAISHPPSLTSHHSSNFPHRDVKKSRYTSFGIEDDDDSYKFVSA